MSGAELATYYLIAVNVVAFVLFGLDKIKAQSGAWRISEDMLIGVVFLGGILGALAGRAAFRHKTRKKGFSTKLWMAALGNLAFVASGTIVILYGADGHNRDDQSWSQPYR